MRTLILLVAPFLVSMNLANQAKAQDAKKSDQVVTSYLVESEAETRIRETLQETVDFEFQDTVFHEVVSSLRMDFGLPTIVLESARDQGLTADESISISVSGTSLRSALNLLLMDYDSAFAIKNEVLLIGSREEFEEVEYYSRRIYDYSDLNVMEDELIDAITASATPDAWEENGGSAKLQSLTVNNRKLLIVSHNEAGHHEVATLIAGIRTAVKNKPDAVDGFSNVDFNMYLVPEHIKTTAEQIVELIQNVLPEVTWDEEATHFLGAHGNVIVVRNHPTELNRVDDILARIGIYSHIGGGGFGGGGKGGGGFGNPAGGGVFSVPPVTSGK